MQEYQVPKEKASVHISAPPRPSERRLVFLSPDAQSHQGPETPSDIFNASQAFLPLFREGGEIVLVRRAAIAWILIDDPRKAEWYYYESRAGAAMAAVRLEFDAGDPLAGEIALVGPTGGQRMVDLANRVEGFVHLEQGEKLYLVNLRRVIAITLREGTGGGAR